MSSRYTDRHRLCILDWDDTLFPTRVWRDIIDSRTFLIYDDMIKIQNLILKILKNVGSQASFCIVTNASIGWIDECFREIFVDFPYTLEDLSVYSARDKYESLHPSDTHAWKKCMFNDVLQDFVQDFAPHNRKVHVTAIGDSISEYMALKSINSQYARYPDMDVMTESGTIASSYVVDPDDFSYDFVRVFHADTCDEMITRLHMLEEYTSKLGIYTDQKIEECLLE